LASKPETTFTAGVNKLIPVSVHREKMHNIYRGGTADVWYSANKADLWVEYKWLPKLPKSLEINLVDGAAPMLSQLQQKWLNARHSEGRNVAVIVGTPHGALILLNNQWMRTVKLDALLTKKDVASWITSMTHHDTKTSTIPSDDS
jgi:hypothetical protein